jgi:hypothetical protein
MNKQFRKITPEAEETGSQEADVVEGTKPGQAETSKQDTSA